METKNRCEVKISKNINHEGKFKIEIVKTVEKKKYIKQYYVNRYQLEILEDTINKMNIKYTTLEDNQLLSSNYETELQQEDIILENKSMFNRNNFDNLESYKKTLNAKLRI